jgi:hypothetical protein
VVASNPPDICFHIEYKITNEVKVVTKIRAVTICDLLFHDRHVFTCPSEQLLSDDRQQAEQAGDDRHHNLNHGASRRCPKDEVRVTPESISLTGNRIR